MNQYPPQTPPPTSSYSGRTPQVSNYLVQSILVALFCCQILGIVGIVYAAQVDGKLRAGDIAGAQYMAEKARTWTNWGFWLGLIGMGAYFLIAVAAGFS